MKNLFKFISILLIIAGLNETLTSQPMYYNSNANGTNNSFPFNITTGKRVQLLYNPGVLNLPTPVPSGTISSIAFRIGDTYPLGPWTYTNLTIQMGQTAITGFTAGAFYSGAMTTVYFRASVVLQAAGGAWLTIALDTPFPYNNTQGLVVDIEQCGVPGAVGFSVCQVTTATNCRIYSGTTTGCPQVYSGIGTVNYAFGINLVTGPNIVTMPATSISAVSATLNGTCNANGLLSTVSFDYGLNTAYGNTVAGVPPTISGSTVTPFSATPAGLTPNTLYHFRAKGTNANGTALGADMTFTTLNSTVTGIITNASNGLPIVGAKVSTIPAGSIVPAYSTGPTGFYGLIMPVTTTCQIMFSKEGFKDTIIASATYNPTQSYVINMAMKENTPPPSTPFTALLNPAQTAVNLNWGLPKDDMVLIYDDGIQDNFAIWATGSGNNMNAMKFTPVGYPAIVKKFYVNIGTAANYPTGMNAFSPVQFAIYNETPVGLPGTALTPPVTVTPTVYGWTEFNFPIPVTIASGNFFIVMIQLGASSASPGIAIDTTVQQLRSYSKFGTTPWIPGPGNFMLRAVVNGSGGPLFLNGQSSAPITASAVPGLIYQYAPATVTGVEGSPKVYSEMGYNPDNLMGYQVWRLLQGQEATPASWTSIGTPSATNIQDNSWPSLPCNPYRWAVKAQYTFNRWSTAIFSNAVGKCWTCSVTINIDLSCDSANAAGALVTFQNATVVDTVYTHVMSASGTYTFTNFWKGLYNLTVNKYGYTIYTQNGISIMGDMTINVTLLQTKNPPTGLHIPDSTLFATWNPPSSQAFLLNEPFTSGSFATNGWVADAGTNTWVINTLDGNPGYCAEFYWYPEITSYSLSLTSKSFTGVGSPAMSLKYDIHLDNFAAANEHLAVELWNGTAWILLKDYLNSGSIAYKTETIDLSAYTNTSFKIRFRVYGDDTLWINWWDIDNVQIVAGAASGHNPCILGYNFYLNGILAGFTPDTFYAIPPSYCTFGTFYHACVLAIYGSGYSTQSCYDFTSKFLCPPNTLTVTPIECNAYLTWKKPDCGGCSLVQYKYDNNVAGDGYTTTLGMMGNYYPIPAFTAGVIKSVDMYFSSISGSTTAQSCIVHFYKPDHTEFGQSAAFINNGAAWTGGTWVNTTCADIPFTGPFYAMVDYAATSFKNFFDVDIVSAPTGYPLGLGYVQQNGVWTPVATAFGYDPKATFLERINVCDNSKGKDAPVTTIDPGVPPDMNNVFPNLGAHLHTGAITDGSNVANNPPVPAAPAAGPVLLGYRIFRNGVLIDTVNNPNTFVRYDYNLSPGTYSYTVDAKYNISPFVTPPFPNHSQPAGPVSVTVSCGYPLPFVEPWTQASFSYQQWTFEPNQPNWMINTAFGDPTPCADFSWEPVLHNYTRSLESPTIDASAWTCADIFFDFDVKLTDYNATGNEKLDIDVLNNGNWVNKLELTNTGSFDWTAKHIDISNVKGKGFKVRFRANGVNSADMLHWYVDNIHIYGECHAPQTLAGHQNQFTTTLTWVAPTCGGGGPTPQWITWDDGTNTNSIGTGAAVDFWIAGHWDASQIVALDGGSITKINFWPASAGSATYTAMIWEGPLPTAPVASQPITTYTNDQWNTITLNTPHPIDVSKELWIGVDVNATGGYPAGVDAGPAVDGYGDMIYWSGAWTTLPSLNPSLDYNWDIEAYVEPSKKDAGTTSTPVNFNIPGNANGQTLSTSGKVNTAGNTSSNHGSGRINPLSPTGSIVTGYNIYRTPDNLTTGFFKVNTTPWATTTYTEVHPGTTLPTTTWKYFVTAVFKDTMNQAFLCEPSSDTITITFPAVGINDLTGNTLSLYPNPANDVVNIVSTNDIKSVEVLNYIGQTVYSNKEINLKSLPLNVSTFKAGVYFVKVTTVTGIKTTKITVTH